MKRNHVLIEKAFFYDLEENKEDMTGVSFDDLKGFWINRTTNQPCIEDVMFAAPRTKKADIETGEDKKGE